MSLIYSICSFLLIQASLWSIVQMDCIEDVEEKFIDVGLPESIGLAAPRELLQVIYRNNKEVCLGNKLDIAHVLQAPNVHWSSNIQCLGTCTLIHFDPDALDGGVLQWCVINIENGDISSGTKLNTYNIFGPAADHRKVFLLFEQNEPIEPDAVEKVQGELSAVKFNVKKFTKKYNLGDPVAGNFYLVPRPVEAAEGKLEEVDV